MRSLLVALLVATASGCVYKASVPASPAQGISGYPADFPASFYAAAPRDQVYRVIPARSPVTVKVYRAGALSALGHNHVIESRQLEGFIYLANDPAKARADLFVPVAGFIVDDPAARASGGPDFTTQPSLSDIDGTRANMLGPKLLDAQAWPFIVVRVAPLHVGPDSTQAQLSITVRNHVAVVPVDVHWTRSSSELTIESSFTVDHATLGLEPFSALGGALRVADQISIGVVIVASSSR